MSFCATGLVTRGYICCDITQNQVVSFDKPELVAILEVRPKIRWVEGPQPQTPPPPTVTTAQELRPRMVGRVEAPAPVTEGPKQVSAQELRPKIVKAEEED
jgi:hypothetical protein